MSRDITDRSRETSWTISSPKGLVDPSWVESEVSDQLTVRCEDPHVPIGHQDQDARPSCRRPTPTW